MSENKYFCECVCGCNKPYWFEANIQQCTRCLIARLHGCEVEHGYIAPPKLDTNLKVWIARDGKQGTGNADEVWLYAHLPVFEGDYWSENEEKGNEGMFILPYTAFSEIKNGECREAEIVLKPKE